MLTLLTLLWHQPYICPLHTSLSFPTTLRKIIKTDKYELCLHAKIQIILLDFNFEMLNQAAEK